MHCASSFVTHLVLLLLSLDAVSPDEFFGDGAFRNFSEVFQVRSILQVHVHAVAEAMMGLSTESVLVHAEGVSRLSTACLEALK